MAAPGAAGVAAAVETAVAEFGKAATLVTATQWPYDPGEQTATRTPANVAVVGVTEDVKATDGSGVRSDRLMLHIAATTLTAAPTTKDHVLIGSVRWNIDKMDTVEYGDTVVLYSLGLTR